MSGSHSAKDSGRSEGTLWSEIVRAGDSADSGSEQAKEWLCRRYWGPVYAFLRQTGLDHEKARDATQDFLLYFLEKNLAAEADPGKGRFRSFLLGILKNFIGNQVRREQTIKRGGQAVFYSWDIPWEEGRDWVEPASEQSPDREYDRRWALTVLDETMTRLAAEYARAGRQAEFEVLRDYIIDGRGCGEAARLLNKTEGACRTALTRLRACYQEMIREVIMETLLDPAQVEDELNHLKAALRGD